MEITDSPEGVFKTSTTEIRASGEYRNIQLVFPGFTETLKNKIRRCSIKIDRCPIKYMPQIPTNSTGIVRVVIHDKRLSGEDQRHAEFCFPVTCAYELQYFGNCFSSINEQECPWVYKYRLEESNINPNVLFCKMKAYLKISAQKSSGDVQFRPPTVTINSRIHKLSDVDFWHVGPKPQPRALCRSTSQVDQDRSSRLLICVGESFQQHRASTSTVAPSFPSTSSSSSSNTIKQKDGCNDKETQPELILQPRELATIIAGTISETITLNTEKKQPCAKPF